ncbi:TPA: hypothetical protein ACV4T5_001357 [Yersinia enterocolitica]
MHRIDTPTAQVDKFGAGKNGFTRGNPQTGVPATALDDDYFDSIQEELAGVVEGSGATLDKSKRNQLLTALKVMLLSRAHPFADIKSDGAAAVAEAFANLQLRESFSGVVGQSRNARMSVVAASSSATFTADELIVETSAGQQYRISAFNKTINLATTGAGGMDTGTVPTSGFIALYAIVNPTSGATALLAVNATTILAPEIYGGANMPAGFIASALVSVWRVSSSQLTVGELMNRTISTTEIPLVTVANTVPSLTELSISTAVPKNAKTMEGWGLINSTAAATNNSFGVSSRPYPLGFKTQGNNNSGVSSVFSNLMIAEPQKIYYQIGFGGTPVPSTIYSTGYTF